MLRSRSQSVANTEQKLLIACRDNRYLRVHSFETSLNQIGKINCN